MAFLCLTLSYYAWIFYVNGLVFSLLSEIKALNWAWRVGSGGNREKTSLLLLRLYPAKHNKLLTALLMFWK